MLIEFRVANYRSIRDEQALSLEAVKGLKGGELWLRESTAHTVALLPTVALYGANASGKSNILSALTWMRRAILDSHRRWEPVGEIPITPFAWGVGPASPSLFEIVFVCGQTKYQYGFLLSAARVLEEWLYAWPNKRRQVWFERDGDDFKFGASLQGHKRLIEEITRPNSLFISAAAQQNHPQLLPVYQWFEQIVSLTQVQRRASALYDNVNHHATHLKQIIKLLRRADLGIRRIKINTSREGDALRQEISLEHEGMAPDQAGLSLNEESAGTQTLFAISADLLDALKRGSVVCMDELEANLHPLICQEIIKTFNEPKLNPHNAQLIFTTHDTMLLGNQQGEQLLRRDQIWLTEKAQDGATTLTPLSAYKPRREENLERGYLQGRYGGVPYLNALFQDVAEASHGQ